RGRSLEHGRGSAHNCSGGLERYDHNRGRDLGPYCVNQHDGSCDHRGGVHDLGGDLGRCGHDRGRDLGHDRVSEHD
ncbi:MAG: hypothetical protein ACKPKO_31120, partial [Candidatus Fonsibacter sp.]